LDQPNYAAFLNLRDRECTVVGGGKIACRKIEKLLAAGARVKVISPVLHEKAQQWAERGEVQWLARAYQPGDVSSSWLVFAATNNRDVNRAIADEAEAAGRLVNVIDMEEECTFTVPATVQAGNIQVAISTSGTEPATARQLRLLLEDDLEHESNRFQQLIREKSR
jgi:precorrin-2 dehydrogenase